MGNTRDLQGCIHLTESFLGLVKETEDDGLTELLAIIIRVIHLQDLAEGVGIYRVAQIREASRVALARGWTG